MASYRRIVLKKRPEGRPKESDFGIEEGDLLPLGEDQVTVQVSHLSIDAFIRTTLEASGFHGSVPIGAPVVALGVGKVIDSTSEKLTVGDWVTGPLMAQTHAQLPAAMLQKIDASRVPPATYLGALGMTTGLTAYFGLLEVAGVKAGDTVVVSGAAGAVGSVACQLAKIQGGRVIGIAGGPEKGAYLTESLGADAAIDYKNEDVGARLDALAPDGVDVYFDNVGGEILDLVLDRLRMGARVSICGAISQYDDMSNVRGPKLYLRLAERNACMCGFTVDRFADRFGEASEKLAGWIADGSLKLHEHIEEGIERFPAALIMLMSGGHMGKMLVKP
ncbi:MAG TPA: NADP-dependent oxidoreductase [Pseudomonadales bacterium]